MNRTVIRGIILIMTGILVAAVPTAWAGNKRIMTIRAAKVMAERAIVESVHGLKLRAKEEVTDMIPTTFEGSTESKTAATIKGIKYDEITYDQEKDIAKVTASVQLDSITNIDGQNMKLGNKVFRRVGFATSTPSMAGPIRALRAAELDAYKQLIKRIVGFELESKTTVENFMLKSDQVKTKVMATLYLAELTDYGWDQYGDAFVKMQLNVQEASAVLGEKVVEPTELVEVEGQGAQQNDFKGEQTASK
ncbi:MAG: hypothetical protein ACOZF0_23865, partial [Thermodesulfobacteriota bacterium]